MQDRGTRRSLTFEVGFPILCGAFADTAAASALLGWMTGNEGLKRLYPSFVAMNPATAVCLAAAGTALIFIRSRPVISRTLAGLAVAVAAAKLIGLGFGVSWGVDQILFPDSLGGGDGPPSRMAPNTAIAIGLLGLALLCGSARSRRAVLVSQIAAGVAAAIALFALLGYLLGMATLYGLGRFIPMAVHTALAILVLAAGTVAARWDMGLMVILRDRGPAGVLARTTLPLAILIPVGVGLLRLAGQRAGLYGTETGVALQVLASVLVTFLLLLGSIYALWRSDSLRREKEAALARSEQQYRLAEDVGEVGHWRMALPSRAVTWSHKIFDIVGLPPGKGVPDAAGVLALYHPRDRDRARDAIVKALRTGEGWSFVIRLVRPDASIRHVRSHGMTEPDEHGGVAALFGVFADVTDLEESRRAAEAATAAKATFLANMSHEVRTPLNSIIGFTDLLLDDPTLDERKRHQLAMVQKSGNLLMTIVDDILNISKLEAGKLELHPEPFPVEALIDNSTSIIRAIAEAKGLELTTWIDPQASPYHLGDEGRLRQVLLNLLNNALKFTASGSIKVEVQRVLATGSVDRLRFSVTDTGPGIPTGKQHRLFKQFSQTDASVSREYGGTGLGLAISKSLIDLMGGHIGVFSTKGMGSTFWFEVDLPRAEAPSPPEPSEAQAAADHAVARTARILLVEDVPFNQELAEAILVRAGHKVRIAGEGIEALKALAQEDFDLILMDVQMPRMDGITATRRIREMEGPKSQVPIVAMTANVLPEQVREFTAVGMNGHVAKPIRQAELHAAIAAVLETGQAAG
jgi:signal transduction histidine kinase/ActR/RegA family two-component response regulator